MAGVYAFVLACLAGTSSVVFIYLSTLIIDEVNICFYGVLAFVH